MEMGRCQEYIDALEEERRKIEVFQRELPLCLQLVTQAIEACRQQLVAEITGARSDCEETSSEGPVLEEFIPLKKDSEDTQKGNCREDIKEDGCCDTGEKDKKPDWLKSVQLWSQDAESSPKRDVDSYKKSLTSETKKSGAFRPFCKEKKAPSAPAPPPSVVVAPAATVAASSTTTKVSLEEKDGSAQKKARRCWSPELHHRFLHALQQLGGSHAATPKQIRDLMKVDGLTNDEVKSHLQKYRLHTRRVPSTSIPMSSSHPAQFVVVGGIWVPPDYSTVAPSAQHPETAPRTVYAPVATSTVTTTSLPASTSKQKKQLQLQSPDGPLSPERRAGGGKCGSGESVGEDTSSSATSSHTTTSPAM